MTDNNLAMFGFEGYEVRVAVLEGQPAWVAADVCKVLGLSNPTEVLRNIPEDWKGVSRTETLGGEQTLSVVTEPGLYQIIFKSRKKIAERFRRWVFEEVLPSIRKTGKYEANAEPAPALKQHTAIEWVKAAETHQSLPDGTLKQLLGDLLVDELELQRNQKALPGMVEKKQYTIVKVRARELGYNAQQIGNGSSLGKFVKSQVQPAYQEQVGRYKPWHYEINEELDNSIHRYFS